jgi:hypothetical protein
MSPAEEPVFEVMKAQYHEVLLAAAAVQDRMPDALAAGAEKIVELCRPYNEVLGLDEDLARDYVYRSLEFHLAVEFSTAQTIVDAAAHIQATTAVRPSGQAYAYVDFLCGDGPAAELLEHERELARRSESFRVRISRRSWRARAR